MKFLGETSLKKLISLIKGEIATKQNKITTNGILQCDGDGNISAASLDKNSVGLGNVGNFKAVSTAASQGLTATEKTNARANIGAGTSSFSGSYNDLSNKPTIPAAVAVKGNAESSYRTGNVNLTPANIGALATNGDSKLNTVSFTSNDVDDASATSWTSVSKLATGITHATFFQRVSQMFKNVRYLSK